MPYRYIASFECYLLCIPEHDFTIKVTIHAEPRFLEEWPYPVAEQLPIKVCRHPLSTA